MESIREKVELCSRTQDVEVQIACLLHLITPPSPHRSTANVFHKGTEWISKGVEIERPFRLNRQ